jgi:hypothetical protein
MLGVGQERIYDRMRGIQGGLSEGAVRDLGRRSIQIPCLFIVLLSEIYQIYFCLFIAP